MNAHFINPIALSIGPVTIYWYGLLYLIGMSACIFMLLWLYKKPSLWDGHNLFSTQEVFLNYIVTLYLVGLLGGRLGYFLFYNIQSLFSNPLEVFAVWHGGMSIHGAFFASLLYLCYKSRANLSHFLRLADIMSAFVPIGLACGRFGNFINGELFGYPTTLPWGMYFSGGGPFLRHPSQLYEMFLEGFLLQGWLMFCIFYLKGLQHRGFILLNFVTGYLLTRSIVDIFFRQPSAGDLIWGIKKSLILSFAIFLVPLVLVLIDRKRGERAHTDGQN